MSNHSVSPSRSFWLSLIPKFVASLLLGALLAWLVKRGGIPLVPKTKAFASLSLELCAVSFVVYVVAHVLRAKRWGYLIGPIKPLNTRDVLLLNWIGFFSIFVLPFRIGEITRPALSKLKHGVSVTAGLGTVAVERIFDGLITSLCLAFGLIFVPHVAPSGALSTMGYLALAGFTCAFIGIGLLLAVEQPTLRLLRRILSKLSERVADAVIFRLQRLIQGFHVMNDRKLFFGFAAESILYWSLSILSLYLLGLACGLPITLGQAVAILGILSLGILLPAGPGLFGSFQMALSAALGFFYIDALVKNEGSLFIFCLYLVQGVVILSFGTWSFFQLRISLIDLVRPTTKPLGGLTAPPPSSSA